ncbi:MAG: PAS domain-containing protein, partial [Cellvibrionaceae bacterium]|nr:PAS domain-containing protein [Cellvibrionaceae bacterium]
MPWFKSKADDSHNTPPKLVDERLSLVAAINQSMATIEFTPSGEVCNANDNFLQAVGYQLDEIKGKHHRIFCTPEYANSQEYVQFWRDLNAGKTISGKIKRVNKHGDILWLEASYTPILNSQGKVEKVVKLAADITQRVLSEQDIKTKVDYLNDSTAIIEFKPDGTITDCNENFLKTTGYTKQQIVGKHHGMLCEPDYANSEEYRQFWQRLNNGEHSSGKFKRIDSNGNPIWLEASYQPVFDFKENLIGVIKFAIDVSKQVEKFQSVEATSEVTKKISTETVEIAEQGGLVITNAVTEMNAIA